MLDPGRLRCPECEFTSTKEKRLVKHVRKSHGKAAVTCPLCVGVHYSSSPEKLCVHKKQQHRSVRLRCFLCEFSSRSLDRWAGHVTRVHSGQTISLVSLASRKRSSSQCFPPEPRPIDVTGTFKKHHRPEKVCTESQGSNSHSPADCVLVESGHSSDHADIRPGDPDFLHVPPLSPRFSCSVCGYSTSKQQNLRKHVTEKHSNLKEEIVPHHVRVEGNNKEINCPYCNLSYPNIRKLSQHCKIEHYPGRLRCPECEFTSTKEKRLVKHVRKSQGKAAVRCPLCVGVHYSSSPEELCVHKKQQHRSVRLRCFLCEFSSRSLDSLASRIRSSSSQCFPPEPRPIDVTGTFKKHHRPEKVCTKSQGANSHSPADCVLVESGHSSDHADIRPDPGRLRCPECEFTSTKEKRLVKHVRKSHGKAGVRCPLCVGVHYSSSPEELCVHKKQQHRSVRLRCFLCEFSSRSLDKWAGHVTRVHSGQTISLVSLASRIRSSLSQHLPPEPRAINVTGTF
ncbi:hypothetical protein RRG08_056947 [Elysia crispata]|uniref:C2H2-type domain-containing protein n=1 Tax=Elysia crispata TaxID=231223 RepID=A0AAE1CT05_9GAST|nr:hypothetical protein RRG08_056947 [Elysia crispata]